MTVVSFALGNLKHRRKQYTVLVIGVLLAMIFSCGVPFFLSCMSASQTELVNRRFGKQDVVLTEAQTVNFLELETSLAGQPGYMHVLGYGWTNERENGTPIAWLDEQAEKLYYLQLNEGRFPEQAGEIAVEEGALRRMQPDAKVGDTLKLNIALQNGKNVSTSKVEKTYTLVGIVSNRKSMIGMQIPEKNDITAKLPSVYVAPDERAELNGTENLVALLSFVPEMSREMRENFYQQIDDNRVITMGIATHTYGTQNGIGETFILPIVFSVLLAFLSCFGIANAFNINLNERKQQIGMLRAVGATKRQIIQLFGTEAALIALFCAPLSILFAYLTVKLFAYVMGDNFVFIPKFTVLLSGGLFGVVCVLLAVMIPLLSIIRLTPMQAIRNTDLTRKMKKNRIRSKTNFSVPKLLAQRKLQFSRGRQIAVCSILALTTLLCCTCVDQLRIVRQDMNSEDSYVDYVMYLPMTEHGEGFVYDPSINNLLQESTVQEILQLPDVKKVYGEKRCSVNLLVDGEVPVYLDICEFNHDIGDMRYVLDDSLDLTRENFKQVLHVQQSARYRSVKQLAGYTQEVINVPLEAREEVALERSLENYVIEGRIDTAKLDAGEEIILEAPSKVGYVWYRNEGGYVTRYAVNLSQENLRMMREDMKEDLQYLVAEGENPYHAGDVLHLSMLYKDRNGIVQRKDREVTIGAIVHAPHPSTSLRMFTTLDGLDCFGVECGYEYLKVETTGNLTPERDAVMLEQLHNLCPDKSAYSQYAQRQYEQNQFRTILAVMLSLIGVMLTVCICLVNNGITAQIREGRTTIGTLRAVGASERDIVRSYALQILNMIVLGLITGMVLYGIAILFERQCGLSQEISIWPALVLLAVMLLSGFINLKLQVKKISRCSIVENIREL